jgi:hypothetical protein
MNKPTVDKLTTPPIESSNTKGVKHIKGKSKGRPYKWNLADIPSISRGLKDYIDKHDEPIMVGFMAEFRLKGQWLNKDDIVTLSERDKGFKELVNLARLKEEATLLKQKDKPVMAIFRLKQPIFGYIDNARQTTEVNVSFSNSIPRPRRQVIDSM